MLPSYRELILDSAISRMNFDEKESLYICTNEQEIYIIDLLTLRIVKKISLSQEINPLFDYYIRPITVKNKLAYVKLSQEGKEYVLNLEKKVDKKCEFDYGKHQKVTKVHFSADNSLVLTGTDKGRSYLIDVEKGSLIYDFFPCTDWISAVAISEDNRFAVISSFDRSLRILHVNSLSVSNEVKIDSVVEMIQFIENDTFLAITRDGRIIKVDAKKREIIQQAIISEKIWPSEICVSHSKKFVYIGTRESKVFALHVNSLELMFSIDLNRGGITSLVRTPKYFIIGFKSGEVQFFNHREYEDNFILNVKLHKIKEATEIFEQNIFLMTHRETNNVYNLWLEKKDSIIQLLSTGVIDKAQEIAHDFLFHPKCKQEMEALEELQPELMALQRYIRSSSYNAAYELSEKNQALKTTLLYQKLEDIWKKALQKAQLLLSRDPILNVEKARYELRDFEQVEIKKGLIEKMLKNSKVFTRAEFAIKNKNFNLYFQLTRENDFLTFTPLYARVMNLADKIKTNIFNFLKEDNYIQALESVKLLSTFSPFASNAKQLEEFINSLILIEYHITHENFLEAIKIQNNMRIQATYKPIQRLNQMKIAYMKKMFNMIENHKFLEVYNGIKNFFTIKICAKETALLMKNFYIEQMKKAKNEENKAVNWEATIKEYGTYFNIDKLLEEFYEQLDLQSSLETLIETKTVKKRDFIPNILVFK